MWNCCWQCSEIHASLPIQPSSTDVFSPAQSSFLSPAPTTQQHSHNTPAKLTAKQISKEKGQPWRLVSQKSQMTKHFFSEDVRLGNQCHKAAGIVK